VAVEFSHTMEGVNSLPNQLLMSLLLKELAEVKGGLKLLLLTSERKMMSFYMYELMKTEKFQIAQ
jgi:hypothetical protein